jgi:hypothetical protein
MSEHLLPIQLPALDEASARKLLAGECGDELLKLVVNHTTFLAIGIPGQSGESEFRNGSCFFIRTPSKLLAVTAKHVLRWYEAQRQRDDRTVCQIGNILVDPMARTCGIGENTDIATFEVTDAELAKLNKVAITLWPPDPPNQDDCGVLLAGFPGAGIIPRGKRTYDFGIYAACTVAQRATDRQLTTALEWENIFSTGRVGDLPPRNYDTGGMSGGPMLAIRERSGLWSFPLAGVISEGRAEDEKIVAEWADNIRADGSIRG